MVPSLLRHNLIFYTSSTTYPEPEPLYTSVNMLGQPPVEFDISSMDTFSIDFYHKMNVMETSANGGGTNYYGIARLSNGSNILNWFVYDVNYQLPNNYNAQQPPDNQWYGATGVSTSIGRWKHIVISHDKINNVIKYYINGTEYHSGGPYSTVSGIANWDKFQLEALRRGGDINSNSDFDYKYRFVPNAMLSPSYKLFGTGNDLPANFGTFSDVNGSIYTIHHWAYDSNERKIIICHINTSQATHTRFCKISVTGIYDDNSSRYKNGGTPPTFNNETEIINYYAGSSAHGNNHAFTKGTNFDDITFGDDDTLSWYSSFDLNTTNFWEYMKTYFVATGQFALTGSGNSQSIRWEGGANGTAHPHIKINLEDGYVLNINKLWFCAAYTKGLVNRKDDSTWWIEDLSPGGLYQFQLYSYNSEADQQFNAII